MKVVQHVRGTQAELDAYTGEDGQLGVDTDNYDIRLFDGVTPGGRLLINRDNGDERWQGKNEELDGLSGFASAARGHLTRIGPGAYRIRVFVVNEDQLTLENANGYGGNPTLSLNTTILTDHIFAGDIIIQGVLQVEGGINANLSGDVTGNLTGNVTGNVTGNLTGDSTGAHTGDVDVRGADLLLDDGQIATSKINGLEAFVNENGIPTGVIVMWSGAEVDIPDGWVLCDGTGGSPDLTDRFVICAGGAFNVGDTGGSASHSHASSLDAAGAHTHAVTVDNHSLTASELPAHEHLIAKNGVDSATLTGSNYVSQETAAGGDTEYRLKGTAGTPDVGKSSSVGAGSGHSHTASSDSDGSHTHTVNNPTASSYSPYYALCYIMKTI